MSQPWQLLNVHAALLYDGSHAKLTMFRNDMIVYDLDGAPGSQSLLDLNGLHPPNQVLTPNGHEVFCAGYVPMADGRLLIVGGPLSHDWGPDTAPEECDGVPVTTGWASIVDPANICAPGNLNVNCWIPAGNLADSTGSWTQLNLPCGTSGFGPDVFATARYYPTCTRLDDGRVLVTAGDFWTDCTQDDCLDGQEPQEYSLQPIWALYDAGAPSGSRWTWDDRRQDGSFTNPWADVNGGNGRMFSYPHVRTLPYGLFYHGNDLFETGSPATHSHLWTPLAEWGANPSHVQDLKIQNRLRSSCVILTLDAASDSVSILLVGGAANNAQNIGADGSELITYHRTSSPPYVTRSGWHTVGEMQSLTGRRDGNSVLLPDGTVFTIGGEGLTRVNQNIDCELFTPNPSASPMSGTWEMVAGLGTGLYWNQAEGIFETEQIYRGHHSVALLLPDGRVVSSGHENGQVHLKGTNYHVYYPPYLFQANGTLAPRDTIQTAPAVVRYGLPFEITMKDGDAADIDEVCLMEPCAVTHTTNFTQSRIRLSHAAVPGTGRLIVSSPKDSTYAQPGNFMLFVLDDGVPSEAKWVKVERQQNSDYIILSGKRTWGGDVWLDRDFEVAQSCTLEVLPGTRVHVLANRDRWNRGVATNRIEIIHQGTSLMPGTVAKPIVFTTYDGTGAAGEWYGHRFDLAGCEREGFGYAVANRPISSIAHTTIENAEYGVRIENLIAPALNNVTFLDIVDFKHIVLDETDVYLPSGYWGSGTCAIPGTYVASPASWTIKGGTYVKATNTCEQDSWIGTAGKVDLVANAPVTTTGSTADGDSVYFHPMEITPVTLPTAGADWGGFTLTPEAAGSLLRFADIGYADVPLTLFYPDGGTSIRRSRIHHFAGVGAWVNGSQGTGGSIDSCVVDRGNDLNGEIGDTGVLLDSADHFAFLGNQVLMHGLTDAPGGTGVLVKFSEVFCQGTSGQSRLLRVDANFVMGPGSSTPSTPPSLPYSGIKLEWLCGSANREIDVGLNWIEDWRTYGVEVVQTADVQMNCNRVTQCRNGLDLYRDFRPTGTSLRLRKNRLEALDQDATFFTVRTNDATKIKLGPDWADRGRNQLMVNVDDTKFIFENDPDSGDQLDARVNYWYTSANLGDPVDDAQEIADRLAPTGFNIDYSDHEEDPPDPDPNCTPTRPAGAPSAAAPGRMETLVDASEEPTSATSGVEPARLELGNPFPNPGEAGVTIELAVPGDRVGEFHLGVFDVSGRRVGDSILSVNGGGKYLLTWNGTDRDGRRVAPGLYFLRVEGPGGFEATRRVSVLK